VADVTVVDELVLSQEDHDTADADKLLTMGVYA